MPRNVTQYTILISCPGDIKDEIGLIESAIDDFNRRFSDTLSIALISKHWSKDAFPQSGGSPQALLNSQIVDDCDAVIAIFWTRYGTPTDEYGSGTEEEIERMLQAKKQVFLYFCDKPVPPSAIDSDGYNRIKDFRKRYENRGIYWKYSSNEEFSHLVFSHLCGYFIAKKHDEDKGPSGLSSLKVVGVSEDGSLSEDVKIVPFAYNNRKSKEQLCSRISELINTISSIHVEKRTDMMSKINSYLGSPVAIEAGIYRTVSEAANAMSIKLSDDFFSLGGLLKENQYGYPVGKPDLIGTTEEKRKYELLHELFDTILDAENWIPIEKLLCHKKCIRFALCNSGDAFDEDVEISLTFPKSLIDRFTEITEIENSQMKYLLRECDMYSLFGIKATPSLQSFDYSKNGNTVLPTTVELPYLLSGVDYSKEFKATLNDVFCYQNYEQGDSYVVKLKIDYIKHHTNIAFPSVFFVRGIDCEIPYSITSKHNPRIAEGTIKIINEQ